MGTDDTGTQPGRLASLNAVVTGSSTGIGRAIALAFAEEGANVVVHCCTSRTEAEAVADQARGMGRRAEVIAADLREPQEANRLLEQAWAQFAEVDIWVNNAGADVLTGEAKGLPFQEKLDLLLETDLRPTVRLSRAAGQRMKEHGSGCILNVGWDRAETGLAGDSGELFSVAKGAIMAFSRSLALSLAPEVRVNCLAPGWIRTAWGENAPPEWQERVLRETPLARWGTPEDLARAAVFLASPDAAYVTGQVFRVNGGAVR